MMPMEPGPEDYARLLAERRTQMEEAQAIARFAHSRSGRLARHLRNLVERIDPTGRQRLRVLR